MSKENAVVLIYMISEDLLSCSELVIITPSLTLANNEVRVFSCMSSDCRKKISKFYLVYYYSKARFLFQNSSSRLLQRSVELF